MVGYYTRDRIGSMWTGFLADHSLEHRFAGAGSRAIYQHIVACAEATDLDIVDDICWNANYLNINLLEHS